MLFFDDFLQECRTYIQFIEKELGVPIKFIGVGQPRALIVRSD
jgi:adenylosuccinate synthase